MWRVVCGEVDGLRVETDCQYLNDMLSTVKEYASRNNTSHISIHKLPNKD